MRKKKDEQEVLQNVVFRMTPSEIERLDKIAEKAGLTRSHFLRNLIITGLEEVEVFDKFGLVRVTITAKDICNWMAKQITENLSRGIEQKR